MLVMFVPNVGNFKCPGISFESVEVREGINGECCPVCSTVVLIKFSPCLSVLLSD